MSKLTDFITKADAKSRILMVGVVGAVIVGGVTLAARYFSGPKSTGAAHIAAAPGGMQSVPGGQVSQEYYKALVQSNEQAAKQAQMSGASAVPTMINTTGQGVGGFAQNGNCGNICGEGESSNVIDDINNLARTNKISQEDANVLIDEVKNNVPGEQFGNTLSQMVQKGKLGADDGRRLLSEYKNFYQKNSNAAMTKEIDDLVKSGKISLATANELDDMQKKNLSPAEYAAELDRLVKEGKISPQLAAQLLAQYTQHKTQEAIKNSNAYLQQLAKDGTITPGVAKDLTELQQRNAPVSEYEAELQKLVAEGKMTPETAAKLLAAYKAQRAALGPSAELDGMVASADKAADAQIDDLVANGKLSRTDAATLQDMIKKDVSPEEYQKELDELVREGKISPDEAKALMATYQKTHAQKALAAQLKNLQVNNASPAEYAEALKKAVLEGKLTPKEAAALLQSYQALTAPPGAAVSALAGANNLPGADQFSKLQQRLAAQQVATAGNAATTGGNVQQFTAAQAQAAQQEDQERQQKIQDLENAMKGEADKLVASWAAPVLSERVGQLEVPKKAEGGVGASASEKSEGGSAAASGASGSSASTGRPLIKAGTIAFAVLDTAVNSDYPDTPVMATIVSGPLKGAKVMGKVTTNQGQNQDRVTLNFTQVDMEAWDKTKSISAFAIDPDTARTVLASNVNYHYMERYGTLMATSFLTGYSSAITNAGTSQATSSGVLSTKSPLSPTSKFLVGLGQIGTTMGSAVQNYINTPPTVTVNAGVGIGILFMSDVAAT